MRIQLNGNPRDLEGPTTIADLMRQLTGSTRGSAVSVDGTVVPRSDWEHTRLQDGQLVELITAVQGG